MPRLPSPSGDNDEWGQILNDYLAVEHDATGALKNVHPVAKSGDYEDLDNKPDNATSDLVAGEYAVNTVAASGPTEVLTLAPAHDVTMDEDCTFVFPTPAEGHTFLLRVSGDFVPTLPAAVTNMPTYSNPTMWGCTTLDGGDSWTVVVIEGGT